MNDSKKVLIIEDEASLREALCDKLEHEGFSVVRAVNGEEGLAVALEQHPDIILLDIVMPRMDGTTVLQKLREDTWGSTAEVIILTNLTENKEVADAIEANASSYLVKSDWKISDIVEKVKDLVKEV